MELRDKIIVITGGSGGIGKAMARAFLREGAKAVMLADLNEGLVKQAAAEIGCDGMACDVTNETQIAALVETTETKHGPIDVFCSNAGAGGSGLLTDAHNDVWQRQWELHVMAHVYAARAVLPGMIERGSGYLMNTASAAGLLAALGSGPYTVTKAAAVKLAEFLAITQGVNTAMAPRSLGDGQTDGIIEPSALADTVVDAMREERFHVLPHPEVEEYVRRKGDNIDRWLHGMQRLRKRTIEG